MQHSVRMTQAGYEDCIPWAVLRRRPKAILALFIGLLSVTPALHAFQVDLLGNAQNGWRLQYPGQTNFYHQVQYAPASAGPWSVVSIQIGTNGVQSWTNTVPATNRAAFFRVLRIPTTSPLDADNDGMDDLYELRWSFLNPLDPSDGQKDQDGDGLTNYGEYLYGTSPTDPDSDKDWASDGYEVSSGTNPANANSTPPLEFRINNNGLYTSNTTVLLDFGPFIAEQVAVSESATMSNPTVRTFSRTTNYTFANTSNGWRDLYVQYRRNGGAINSPVISSGIYLDTVRPSLTIDSPANGLITTVSVIHIEGVTSDNTGPVTVTVNGQHVDGVSAGRYTLDGYPLAPGTNNIVVVAIDGATNTTTLTNVCVLNTNGDVTAPAFLLDMPLAFQVSAGITNYFNYTRSGSNELLCVHGAVSEPGAKVIFNVATDVSTQKYDASITGTDVLARVTLSPGTNILYWTVSDAAGNQSSSNRMVIQDTNFNFQITLPADLSLQTTSSVFIAGIASTNLRGATISVNGIAAAVVDQGTNLSFKTTSPLQLKGGVTHLTAIATANGLTYYAAGQAAPYIITHWHRNYDHTYTGIDPGSVGYWIYDEEFIRDDSWDFETRTNSQRRIYNQNDIFYYYSGASEGDLTNTDYTTSIYPAAPITYGYFGFDDVRNQFVAYGINSLDHDHLTIGDQVTFVKVDEARQQQSVILHFDGMGYLGNTFWGQPGFWFKGNVSFLVPIETFRSYTVTESDFTWPAFQFHGPRTDMEPWYSGTAVASTTHMLKFNNIGNQVEPMEWLEGKYRNTDWAAVWCKLDLGSGNISTANKTVFQSPRIRAKDFVDQTIAAYNDTALHYSAAINGNFFNWLSLDTTCSSIEGFVGTSTWSCGNSTRTPSDGGNRWGFGISASSPDYIAHDVDDGTTYQPSGVIKLQPYGLNNVGLLLYNGVAAFDDPTWPAHNDPRSRSMLVWSRDRKHLFMIVIGFHEEQGMVNWADCIDFIRTTFRDAVRTRMPTFEAGDAIMLDGGTSTQLSFRRRVGNQVATKDWADNFSIPGFPAPKFVPTLVHAFADLPQN